MKPRRHPEIYSNNFRSNALLISRGNQEVRLLCQTIFSPNISHKRESSVTLTITERSDWTFAGLYYDEGITGTKKDKRPELLRMISDCEAGKIDLIVTKSISRFSRNTTDCLELVRKLLGLHIPIFFEKESINTMDAKGEVLITIMASLAQQESQSLSQNVKLGLQYRYQQGKVQVNHNHFLGYTKDENGKLVIDPEQAEVVKRIYREYLEGYSMKKICQHLEADGVLTGAGKTKWYDSTINKILRNEKYMGDALLQKTYTTDFLTKKRVKNTGIVPQYYVEDDHEAIIPKELFMQVQAELVRRRNVHATKSGKKRCFSGNNCFSQIVCCGECGELYRRIHWNNRGKKSIVWRCISRLEPSAAEKNCTNRTVSEDLLKEISLKAINRIRADSDSFIKQIQENVAKAVMNNDSLSPEGLDKRLEELQKELIDKANSKQDYDAIADEIFRLRSQKQQSQIDAETQKENLKRVKELQDFIASQPTEITEFDEDLVRRLIEKITVFADHFTVEFKSGVSVDIKE
ncbi:MAG: recombinase family protein [Lachnospiraceae bacterium]|uniref:Recombinase family protein n=1 Tax=Candidatus Weimeria bifida TaxID=2599074 RepID=A0A6N7IZH7_9FIRM|nr:recombinase family protein [Candidatus Weimeria bifida]RRF94590.1 MAG: recombinase family protein [Lachnospiraceae bacterium]